MQEAERTLAARALTRPLSPCSPETQTGLRGGSFLPTPHRPVQRRSEEPTEPGIVEAEAGRGGVRETPGEPELGAGASLRSAACVDRVYQRLTANREKPTIFLSPLGRKIVSILS